MCHCNLPGDDDPPQARDYNTVSHFNLKLVKNLASDISINHFWQARYGYAIINVFGLENLLSSKKYVEEYFNM